MTRSTFSMYINEMYAAETEEAYITEAAKLVGTDKYGNYTTNCKLKGTNIVINVYKGKPDETEANEMIHDLEGYTKVLNKGYNAILEEVANKHMDYAKTCYEDRGDNYYKKYAENLKPNKNILKLLSATYLGEGSFSITFDSELIKKDGHLCFVEVNIINNKAKASHITFEG